MAVADQPAATLDRAALPSLYRAASDTSSLGQRAATRLTGARLLLLLAAAAAGAVGWTPGGEVDVLALGAAVAFFLALLLEVWSAAENPEQRWYRGRAVAESVKTLAWKFAVGGSPFETGRADAEALLVRQLTEILRNIRELDWAPGDVPDQVTAAMRALRERPLAERRAVYQRDRIDDQFDWYTRKSRRLQVVAGRWSLAVYAVTGLGFAGALLKGVGAIDVDVLGLASAGVASAVAWTQLRQYRALAAAYAVTALELGLVKIQVAAAEDEESWAAAVNEAEDAVSREHTLWLARRDRAP